MCRDIYGKYIDKNICQEFVELYDVSGRQLYRLREAWGNFSKNKPKPIPIP